MSLEDELRDENEQLLREEILLSNREAYMLRAENDQLRKACEAALGSSRLPVHIKDKMRDALKPPGAKP